MLQRAVRAGATVRVVYATDGENNPWPQRVLEKKWRLTESDRASWGQRRQAETLAALDLLGVSRSNVDFLGLPDQGLTSLLLSGCPRALNRLAQCIMESSPTDMLWPDLADTHPDHSALAVMLRLVFETLPRKFRRVAIWNFLVHGQSDDFFRRAAAIRQCSRETVAKIAAINCHKTQLKLSRRRFIRYAGGPEFVAPSELNGSSRRTALNTCRTPDHLVVTLRPMPRRLLYRPPNVLLLGCDSTGEVRSIWLPIDVHGRVSRMFDAVLDECIGTIRSEGTLFSGLHLEVPARLFASNRGVYIKVERRGIFFDEAGWIDAAEAADDFPVAEPELEGELSPALG
jgi:LmbE family N-acetylglucosaminyl deacetylase